MTVGLDEVEEWRAVPGLAITWIEASSRGRVRSVDRQGAKGFVRGKILGTYQHDGRTKVGLRLPSGVKQFNVSRLICAAFHGPPPPGKIDCAHNNGDRGDDRPANLRWDTRKGNLADTAEHGTRVQGTKSHLARLDDAKVRDIRARRADGALIGHLALEFAVDPATISLIVNRRTWKHVE